MAKREIITNKIKKPSGHFSQATVIEAEGRLVFISGMTAHRPDGSLRELEILKFKPVRFVKT